MFHFAVNKTLTTVEHESLCRVLELKPLERTVHVAPQHLHPLAVELAVVETEVVLDVPVELARQAVGSLPHLPARPHPSPALQVQLVLPPATELLQHHRPHTDLTEAHTEVVLLQAAPGCVSPVLSVLGLKTGTAA